MLLLLCVLVPAPILAHFVAREVPQGVVLTGMWVVTMALLLGVRRGAGSAFAGHGFSAMVMITAAFNAVPLGGVHSPPAIAMLPVPLVHTIIVRGRSNWLWCAVAAALYVVLGAFTEGSASVAHEKTIVLVVVLIALTAVASLYEATRREQMEELTTARERAEAAAEAKSQFLANMSHEIRTPLNGVLGMLGLMLEEKLDRQLRDYAQTAHGSGVILLDLINDILDFSKIEAGQMMLDATPFDLRGLVEDVLDQQAVAAGDKGVELISRHVPGTSTHVVGDPGRIRQILLNLVSNAVKFTHEGHVLVTVEQVESEGDATVFRCSVEDTGIGIAPQQQARVFEHFQQVDGSASREHAGTGLGLAIVRELTTLMRGRVGVSSEPGKGSTFWFELPLPISQVPAESRPEHLEGLLVLIVDDNRVNRWVLREQLTRWGFETEEAPSGVAALEVLRNAALRGRPVDIALLDYHMPRMDGLELTRTIKADDRLGSTRLVMLSSVTHRMGAKQLLDAGCAAYLVKPVHQSDLMNTLANVWAERDSKRISSSDHEGLASGMDVARGRRILVVEDNAINQKVAVRMLTTLGAHVDVAGDGMEALTQVEAFPYDLVFMDVQMPRMDGLEATAKIREREAEGRRLTIVAMTAHAQTEDRDRCLAAGMDDYVRKPVTRRALVRCLREHLGPHTAARAPADGGGPADATEPLAGEPAPIDLEWLRTHYDEDDGAVKELLRLFMSEAAELLIEMKASWDTEDREAFGKSLHALKGQCGTVRASAMYELLSADPTALGERIPELDRRYSDLRDYLARVLDLRVDVSAQDASSAGPSIGSPPLE